MCWPLSNPFTQLQPQGHSLRSEYPRESPGAMVPRSTRLDQGATRTGHKTTGPRQKPRYQAAQVKTLFTTKTTHQGAHAYPTRYTKKPLFLLSRM
jgi:hypothetical protein